MPKKTSLAAVREATSVEGGQEGGTITSRIATVDVVEERARRAGAEERGGSPLLLDDSVIVGGGVGVGVDRGQGACALDELEELVVIALDPLPSERAGQCRPKCEGLAGSVHVEDGDTR